MNIIQYVKYQLQNKQTMMRGPESMVATKQQIGAQMQTVNSSTNQSSSSPTYPRRTRKYGNLIVLFENDRFLITIGPDYWCFCIAMILFIILYFFTVKIIYSKPGHEVLGAATLIGSIIQIFSYIIVAISNPGILTSGDFQTQGQEQSSKVKRFCNICNLPMLPRARHCTDCDVCIKGYDHHCPWTSKCIGQHNLYRFYFFAGYTPFFIVYCVIVLSVI